MGARPRPRRAARGRADRAGGGAGRPGRDPLPDPRRLGPRASRRPVRRRPRRSRSTREHARGGRPPHRRRPAPSSCWPRTLDQVDTLRRVRGDIRTVRKVVLVDGHLPRPPGDDVRGAARARRGRSRPRSGARSCGASTRCRPDVLATVLHPHQRGPDARRRAAYACGVGPRGQGRRRRRRGPAAPLHPARRARGPRAPRRPAGPRLRRVRRRSGEAGGVTPGTPGRRILGRRGSRG